MTAKQIRYVSANIALALFVISTSIGFFIYREWLGFVALGITSGIAAIFLGADEE